MIWFQNQWLAIADSPSVDHEKNNSKHENMHLHNKLTDFETSRLPP
jgi:hypothetical protein